MNIIQQGKQVLSLSLPKLIFKQLILEASFLSFFTALFILIFQPFGTYEHQMPYKTQLLLGYGAVIFVSYLPIKKLIMVFLKEEHFTFRKELVTIVITFLGVSFICFLYFRTFIMKGESWSSFPDFLLFCFAIGLIPILIIIYSRYTQGIKLLYNEKDVDSEDSYSVIILEGTNQSEVYQFNGDDIVYLQSSGNYVEVFFTKDEVIKSVLIRNTLAQLKAQIPQETFQLVHRSYVINRKHFSYFKKEQGKGTISTEKWDINVPVSRANLTQAEQIAKDYR